MSDNNYNYLSQSCYKEVVNVSVDRVYDACSDKDCFEDLQVYFTDCVQPLINQAISVKFKKAEVANVLVNVESIAYNNGFFAVDITIFFRVYLDVFTSIGGRPMSVEGLAIVNKKVILYGSEGESMSFTSTSCGCNSDTISSSNMPKATVELVDPIALSARIVDICDRNCCNPCYDPCSACGCGNIPSGVASQFQGNFVDPDQGKMVLVTIGLFSIIYISRKVQLVIPACGFGIPTKECVSSEEDPCGLFYSLQFPTDQFFPPKMPENSNYNNGTNAGGCTCKKQ